jgi:F-type H+-transporting ATPase subunit b
VGDNPLVQPDPGLFVWTILTFLVLVGLLAKFAWRPLLDALDRREKTIAAAVEDARKTREELERVQQEGAALLAQARRDADALVTRARADAERFGEELRAKAGADAQRVIDNAEKRIQQDTARAMQQIRRDAVELSVAIASKLLRREVSAADQDALVDETVRQIETRRH